MVGNSKVLLTLVVLFISGCQQTMMGSLIIIKREFVTEEFRSDLVGRIYSEILGLDGSCSLISREREFHNCRVVIDGQMYIFALGFTPKGSYLISLEHTHAHLFPASRQKVLSGRYIPNNYKIFETWIKSLIPDDAVLEMYRRYIGYEDFKEPF